jgi:hypothetical protein
MKTIVVILLCLVGAWLGLLTMHTPDWAFNIGLKVSHWLNPVVHLVGLALCIWAYRSSRKAGYLLVALYFLLAVCSLTLVPAVNRAIAARQPERRLAQEVEHQYIQELGALSEKYYPSGPPPGRINIPFPLGPIILVLGVWVLAKREPQREAEPIAGGNAAPPRAST